MKPSQRPFLLIGLYLALNVAGVAVFFGIQVDNETLPLSLRLTFAVLCAAQSAAAIGLVAVAMEWRSEY